MDKLPERFPGDVLRHEEEVAKSIQVVEDTAQKALWEWNRIAEDDSGPRQDWEESLKGFDHD